MATNPRNARSYFGWVLYDWANSAFVLCVVTVIGAQYFIHLFEDAAKAEGGLMVGPAVAMRILGFALPGEAIWSFIMSAAALFVVLTSPFLGSIADAWRLKRRFLAIYCLLGVVATLALAVPQPWWAVGLLILVGLIGFEGGNVFYNAFLPEIAPVRDQDRLSSRGFAAGYVGGVIALIASLVLFTPFVLATPVGPIRLAFILIALWWGGFGAITLLLLPEAPTRRRGGLGAAAAHAWRELSTTVRNIARYPEAAKFLLAFVLYNDGIATLISNVTPYALQNIYLDAAMTQRIGTAHLILAIVTVQLVAFPGSLFFGWLAGRAGSKAAILSTLAVFVAVVTYGQTARMLPEFYAMCAATGWVLGGSQAISRGLFASFVPAGKSAEFFAFFALSDRVAAMLGPFTYGMLLLATGSTRLALTSLTVFFAGGALVLWFVNVERGRRQARSA